MPLDADKLAGLPSIRHTRRRWVLVGFACGAAIALLTCALAWLIAGRYAPSETSRDQLLASESEFLASEAEGLLENGDRYQAVQVALSALPKGSSSTDRPFVPAAQMALEDALEVFPQEDVWTPAFSEYGLLQEGCTYGEDGATAALDRSGQVVVLDADEGTRLATIDVSGRSRNTTVLNDELQLYLTNDRLICLGDGIATCYAVPEGTRCWEAQIAGCTSLNACALSRDKRQFAVVARPLDDGANNLPATLYLANVDTGKLQGIPLTSYSPRSETGVGTAIALDEETEHAILGIDGSVVAVNLQNGTMSQTKQARRNILDVDSCAGMALVVSQDEEDSVLIQAFDKNLKELWSHEETARFGFNSNGAILTSGTRMYGLYECPSNDATESTTEKLIFALLGGTLVGLDPSSGKVEYRLTRDAPLMDCHIQAGDKDAPQAAFAVFAVTGSGEIVVRSDATKSSIYDTQLGAMSDARFVLKDGVLHLVAWSSRPDKLRTYVFGGRGMLLGEGQTLSSITNAKSFCWNGSCRVAIGEDQLMLLDRATLEPTVAVDLAKLNRLDPSTTPGVCFSQGETLYIYGHELQAAASIEVTDNTVVYKVNTQDGTVLDAFSIRNMSPSQDTFDSMKEATLSTGERWLATFDSYAACVVDATNGTELCRIPQQNLVQNVYLFDNVLVVHWGDSMFSKEGFEAYDVTSGETLSWDVSSHHAWTKGGGSVASDQLHNRLALACSDGSVRLFNMNNGSIEWSSGNVSAGISFLTIDERTGNVLLQDELGHLVLLGGDTGNVIAASAATVPNLKGFFPLGDEGMGLAHYEKPGLAQHTGIVVISLDKDEFGPVSNIRDGLFANQDASRVAIWDSIESRAVITRRPSLDQLLEMGELMSHARPLSDAERRVYRVE